ncbi:MFS general substrate transporter [Daldinia grandis]|nr:MFS general substrate transporter [Daldinia grandis]
MREVIRETSIGQIARLAFGRKDLFPYPEELPSFQLPASLSADGPTALLDRKLEAELKRQEAFPSRVETSVFSTGTATPSDEKDLEAGNSQIWDSGLPSPAAAGNANPKGGVASVQTTPVSTTPVREPVIVDWYSDTDPANPVNWPFGKKLFITTQMGLYTFAVYIGSSLYAPAEIDVMASFGASYEVAALGIALYVFGYGLGPLLWSPLSEMPAVGRSGIFIVTFFIFVMLALGASLVNSLSGLFVLRFLLGFFGSPCLAAAGATLDDMFVAWKLPYVLTVWSSSATLGPALGPIISGFAVTEKGWRWSGWELFWMAAPVWVLMFLTLPETNPDTILHRRVNRLRAHTGRSELISEEDLKRAHMSALQEVVYALIKPFQINALDPAILYTTCYATVLYTTYYSFFEAFPIVFSDMHGFNLGESGLPFLAFVPGLFIAVLGYIGWFRLKAESVMRREPPPLYGFPEARLLPGVATTFLAPIGLFIFAWTSRPDIHWIVPIIGLTILFISIFIAFQCMSFYIARCYPKYSASLFAANTFARSSFAAGSILFSKPMYEKLGVGGGVSLLGGLSILCAIGMICLYLYGDRLRARSRFAQSS